MIVRWMLGGIVVVSFAFFLPARTADPWSYLNVAGTTAAIYLVALLAYTLRKPIPTGHRIIIGGVALVSMVALGVHWTGMLTTTQWQQSRLLENKSLVVRGIMMSEAPLDLVSVLQDYHAQGKTKKLSLEKTFLLKYPHATSGSNIYNYSAGEDSTRIFVTTLSDSMIVLTASHAFAPGRSSDFLPYWGRKGTLQERFILTEKGVRHESDN